MRANEGDGNDSGQSTTRPRFLLQATRRTEIEHKPSKGIATDSSFGAEGSRGRVGGQL